MSNATQSFFRLSFTILTARMAYITYFHIADIEYRSFRTLLSSYMYLSIRQFALIQIGTVLSQIQTDIS